MIGSMFQVAIMFVYRRPFAKYTLVMQNWLLKIEVESDRMKNWMGPDIEIGLAFLLCM